jgi:hypothetical protein
MPLACRSASARSVPRGLAVAEAGEAGGFVIRPVRRNLTNFLVKFLSATTRLPLYLFVDGPLDRHQPLWVPSGHKPRRAQRLLRHTRAPRAEFISGGTIAGFSSLRQSDPACCGGQGGGEGACAMERIKTRLGTYRFVVLVHRWAIKFPRADSWRRLREGLLANRRERRYRPQRLATTVSGPASRSARSGSSNAQGAPAH